ncbi:AMP-binding protein [Alteromonas pelagimontana]|uniref:AMP-binding protein n=1 Tax=Alteromonas pelagimontana TaxID=1858656 RepID=A0A6M4MGL6_9ALTE|nr:AMP-binding protein [Alteromonas pelagimontana]QJR82334.1 AMP-binding protein [Alteromonas pelagimontana]
MPLDPTLITNHPVMSPLTMLYQWEASQGESVYLTQPVSGNYETYTWKNVANLARRVAARLQDLQLEPGSRIGIFSKNCAEWFIADLGIMMAGHVSVPIFSTAGEQTIQYILQHANVKLLFVGKLDDADKQIAAIPEGLPTVAFPYPGAGEGTAWSDFIDCAPIEGSPAPDIHQVMTIIYTSGSTGRPKGVVHTFKSVCWAAQNAMITLALNRDDRLLSYLPLAHITERVLVELASLYAGGHIYFVESLETFHRDIHTCEPTLFISVPRLWTKFQLGILAKIPQKKLDILLKIPLLNQLVASKIRRGLSLQCTRLWASGSAPLAPAITEWFHKIGIHISEGWGMTENSAYGTASVPFRKDKIGTIGKAYEGVDIRIAENGEIQVKSPCNMHSYYLEPEKTAEVLTADGYLKTGDKGEMDSEGYIRITGRLKDIFKTAKGKYVAPAPIEAKLMENPFVEQVCVSGTNLPQPVALVVLSKEAYQHDLQSVGSSLLETFNNVNAALESHQVLDRLLVMEQEWTIENDLLTPTLKVKRHVLEARFETVIQENYRDKLVWINR